MASKNIDFSAREPALGYFYQVRYALFILLSNRQADDQVLKIESLDDIEIEGINKHQVLQTKLHLKSKANLTDTSEDFWKTIRIWSEHIKNGLLNPSETLFTLVSTESTSSKSILNSLTSDSRSEEEVDAIISKLDFIVTSSTSVSNSKSYEAYSGLTVNQKKALIQNVHILDGSLDMDGTTSKIKRELAFSAPPGKIDAFLEILEGWWFQKAIDNLQSKVENISFKELQIKVTAIRDTFSHDNLPNHFAEQLEISDKDAEELKEKTYIKQLEIISLRTSSLTVKRAISDYRRAFEQRSKWMRQELLNPEEEALYDNRLYDYWRNIFDILKDEGDGKTAQQLEQLGKQFYVEQFVRSCPQVKIREKFNEDYLARGSYHMLADRKKIGWHPDFENLLE